MNNQLEGIYAPYIKQYIDFKKSLGFKYNTETKVFSFFDRLLSGEERKLLALQGI